MAFYTHSKDAEFVQLLHAEFKTEEQRAFVDFFRAYLRYDTRCDFVIDFDDVMTWMGFAWKDDAKTLIERHLERGKAYACSGNEKMLLTIHGFKQLCMVANTGKAMEVLQHYINMEEILFKYCMEKQARELAAKDDELSRLREKTYEEVPKFETIYIFKAASELHTDRHKIGKTIDVGKRESQLNTSLAQGGRIIYARSTHNAKVAEDVIHEVLRRYHFSREHFQCRLEHSIAVIDVVCTVIDTVASCYEHATRDELIHRVQDALDKQRSELPACDESDVNTGDQQSTENNTLDLDALVRDFVARFVVEDRDAWFTWEQAESIALATYHGLSSKFPKGEPTLKQRFARTLDKAFGKKEAVNYVTVPSGEKKKLRCFKGCRLDTTNSTTNSAAA